MGAICSLAKVLGTGVFSSADTQCSLSVWLYNFPLLHLAVRRECCFSLAGLFNRNLMSAFEEIERDGVFDCTRYTDKPCDPLIKENCVYIYIQQYSILYIYTLYTIYYYILRLLRKIVNKYIFTIFFNSLYQSVLSSSPVAQYSKTLVSNCSCTGSNFSPECDAMKFTSSVLTQTWTSLKDWRVRSCLLLSPSLWQRARSEMQLTWSGSSQVTEL